MVFSRKKLLLVIALTSAALIGILTVQYFWIDAAANTQKKKFNRQIMSIADNLEESVKNDHRLRKSLFHYVLKASSHRPIDLSEEESQLRQTLSTKIDSLFERENLNITYDFGLVLHNRDCQQRNTREKVLFSSLDTQDPTPILKTRYKTCACILNEMAHINFHFPHKDFFIAKQIGWMLGLSIAAILMIVGCFAYTILTIRKQKKLAEMKNDFINNMTHEFKTPIFSISLASKALRKVKEIRESPKFKKYLDLIDDENKRLQSQVNKVLQMALIDSEGSKLNKEEVDLHTLIRGVANSFDLMLEERNGSIDLQLNARKNIIKADETHLSNIFHSLIDNAIKYSEDQPDITITTEDKEDGVCFSISDNGIGMDSETQKHIFDKFYRAQSGDRHDVKGFGLGLSYVKNIVQAHQGWIDLKSKLNKGSTFTVFLPA